MPKRLPGSLRQALRWLLSPKHFHYKLLFGTMTAVVVIIFLAGVFLFFALRNHEQEARHAHTVQLMRLSSAVENDIAALEGYHRGFLLTANAPYREGFQQRRDTIKKRMGELSALIVNSPTQRKQVIKAQQAVLRWIDEVAEPVFISGKGPAVEATSPGALASPILDQAREVLESLHDEEQIVLSQQMREEEWATQSTQILDFVPKLERAVIEMDKEKRGFLLTGDGSFIEAYRRSLGDFYTCHGYLMILVANSAQQAELLSEIRSNLERWINSSAVPEIEAKRNNRGSNPVAGDMQSEQLLRKIREAISNFQKNELRIYETRSTLAARRQVWKTIGLSSLALFAVALLISSNSYSFVLVRRQLSKLTAAEQRIRAIIESMLDGMITVDEGGTIRSMNPAAEKMFGCLNNEMVGHKFINLVPKAYATEAACEPIRWEDFAQRTGSTTLAVGRTRKQTSFPVEISLSRMVVDHTMLYVAMVRDVTERKRFEREIAAEKESLAVTLRSIGDGVITTDVQGKIIMLNHTAEALTGWTMTEARSQPLRSVFNVSIDLAAQARDQRSGYRSEAGLLLTLPQNATLVAKDGTERLIEQVASPIRDPGNEVAGVVLVFRDITEREHTEGERRKAEALEQLGLLAGGIAHDFNNLLTAIIGNISLASLLVPAPSEMTPRLNDAKNASMRARELAQQLLTFARGGAPIKKTASIGKLIQDTAGFSLRGSQSRTEFHLDNGLWPVEIDPGQISQVIANLVVNAEQAMPNGGTLHITCKNFRHELGNGSTIPELVPGDYVKIAIQDEGVGIPEQYLKRIFDPYFTTKPKGSGLGLATTYSIIKNHKGLITVESEVNMGSNFTIYLPAAAQGDAPQETQRSDINELAGAGRILVVDDEEAIRALVEFTLSHLGYEVCAAETALGGVELYREKFDAGQRFDVVILDLTLPGGMGGKDALKRLQEIDPTVNAIVSSGYAMDATMSRYQDFGFRGVITKPYEAADLGRIVREVIESSRVKVVPDREMKPSGNAHAPLPVNA